MINDGDYSIKDSAGDGRGVKRVKQEGGGALSSVATRGDEFERQHALLIGFLIA